MLFITDGFGLAKRCPINLECPAEKFDGHTEEKVLVDVMQTN